MDKSSSDDKLNDTTTIKDQEYNKNIDNTKEYIKKIEEDIQKEIDKLINIDQKNNTNKIEKIEKNENEYEFHIETPEYIMKIPFLNGKLHGDMTIQNKTEKPIDLKCKNGNVKLS